MAGRCLHVIVVLALMGAVSAASGTASAAVVTCNQTKVGSDVGLMLSARGMSCRSAAVYYHRHRGDNHVPIHTGIVRHIGRFACRVYQDLTPPGPSDTWVRIRCVSGRQAFRLEWGL